jgi:hypothetical protein
MNDKQFAERALQLLAQEYGEPERWFYLSFASEGGFLGGAIIKAHGITDAVMKTLKLKINPGGEVMALPIIDESKLPDETFRNRLLNRNEVDNLVPPKGVMN